MLPELIFSSLFLKNYLTDIMETKLTDSCILMFSFELSRGHPSIQRCWMGTDEGKVNRGFLLEELHLFHQTNCKEVAIPSCSGSNEESLAAFVHVNWKKASLVDTDQDRSPSALLLPFRVVVMRRRNSSGLGSLSKKNNTKPHTTTTNN